MKQRKVSQRELANAIGMTQAGFNLALKSGDFKVSILSKIADYLHVPISYFFDDSPTAQVSGKQVVNGNAQIIVQKLEERNDQLLQQLIECQKKLEKCKDEMIELLRKRE